MAATQAPRPTAMRRAGDDRLAIAWADGRSGSISFGALRDACPCAGCREERRQPPNPFRVLKPGEIVGGPPRPMSMTPVGNYAYKIVWNDGHDTGIYPLELLYCLSVTSGETSEKGTT
jgi:DUF971 family protein